MNAFVFAFCCALAVASCDAARLLVVPFMNGSHLNEHDGFTQVLLERGHEVHILLSEKETIPKRLSPKYKQVSYRSVEGLAHFPVDSESQKKFISSTKDGDVDGNFLMGVMKAICTDMMSDKDLFPKLEKLNFDLVIVDNFFAPCFFLVPYKLGIPFVASGTVMSGWYLRLPVLPSVVEPAVDFETLGVTFCLSSTRGSFKERVCRLIAYALEEAFFTFFETDYLRQYTDFPSITEIRENASLTLVNRHYLLSAALPKLPHVEYVGGVTTRPANPLNPELQKWMDEAKTVVVVSFGSRFDSLPTETLEKMFDAFGRTPYSYLFRLRTGSYDGKVPVPKNVRLMDWLPQNDALGHNHTRLFITHSGNNGQLEALYHGVPMLCFFIHADQHRNALRIVKRGYGSMINIHSFTADELLDSTTQLIENTTYSERIKKASRIFHSEKHPSERAANAIEHVLKYGGDHLRPKEAYKLTWWQFYMLDVLGALFLSAIAALLITVKLSLCLVRCICCRRRKASTKAKTD